MNTVLVIDPDLDTCRTIQAVCKERGVMCLKTRHLSEGRKIWKASRIGLIILDLFISDKSSLAFIDEVTSQEDHSSVVATFWPPQAPKINIYQLTSLLDVSYTLRKPLESQILQKIIQDLLPPGPELHLHFRLNINIGKS